LQFRKDINGLRAIAVIAVVLFHFNPAWLPGGFAGVDVFFVISGYLMTGIIFRGLEQENFAILKFYVARANRIVPALAILCLVLLVFGWFVLIPTDYALLGKHVGSSLSFISNITYWGESGYFDSVAREKWLLHTWSLSAEWQFYIIYPIGLVVLRKVFSIDTLKKLVVIATVIAFLFSVWATFKMPVASYFLLPMRAWEMLLGGVACLYPLKVSVSKGKYIELLGLSIIVGSYALISKYTPWPGYMAIFPVLGSYLIIQAQQSNSYFTGNLIFQLIGKWSYSIYLWHWPIVVLLNYYQLSNGWLYFGLAASIALGYISYKYIESFKNAFPISSLVKVSTSPFTVLLLTTVIISVYIHGSNGAYVRFTPERQDLLAKVDKALGDWGFPAANMNIEGLNLYKIQGSSQKNILFIGGSHVQHTFPYVNQQNNGRDNIYYMTEGGCIPIPSEFKRRQDCINVTDYKKIFKVLAFEKIVTSSFLWTGYLQGGDVNGSAAKNRAIEIDEMLSFFHKNAKEVYVVMPEPVGDEFSPKLSINNTYPNKISVDTIRSRNQRTYNFQKKVTKLNIVHLIDPIDYLCSDICKTNDEEGFYYKDSNHFRPWYAKKYMGYLKPILNHKSMDLTQISN
jgi:peptidoglycan/LPS O-acetylase OafA/YrhL